MNDKCILCRKCVTTCPMHALKIENRKVILNKKDCIGCLCCDEICPQGAVDIIKKFDIRKVK
jgi:Fe-S-cluster-containing hydrogenase component 2